jgi:hypothetical protein
MIASHPDLCVVGVDPSTQTVRFLNKSTHMVAEIPRLPQHLHDAGADDILAILEGRENPKRIEHVTRIVGYFSHVKDWNGSKVEELRARRRTPHRVPTGDYQLGGRSDSD